MKIDGETFEDDSDYNSFRVGVGVRYNFQIVGNEKTMISFYLDLYKPGQYHQEGQLQQMEELTTLIEIDILKEQLLLTNMYQSQNYVS